MTIPERQTVVLYPDGTTDTKDYSPSRNNYRLQPSHRLNLSLNYTRQKRRGQALWSFGAYNAYNNMNPNFVFVDDSTDYYDDVQVGQPQYRKQIKLTKITLLPIIPSISYTYKF